MEYLIAWFVVFILLLPAYRIQAVRGKCEYIDEDNADHTPTIFVCSCLIWPITFIAIFSDGLCAFVKRVLMGIDSTK